MLFGALLKSNDGNVQGRLDVMLQQKDRVSEPRPLPQPLLEAPILGLLEAAGPGGV